jgi:hypothetical protein
VGNSTVRQTTNSSGVYVTGTANISGNATIGGVIRGQAATGSGDVLFIGDDTKLVDIAIAHTAGLYSQTDTLIGSLKLGSNGGIISGYNGNIGIGTSSPIAKLDVVGTANISGNVVFGSTISVAGNATINAIIANGSIGSANQILISNGSGVYWGSSSGASSIRQTFTANATVNTTFTIVGGYSPGYIDVYKNGVKLINGTDVTVTSGSVVVLATAAPSNTVIDVVAFNAGTLSTGSYSYSSYISQQFTANGTSNTFTISGGYIPSAIEVFVGGVKQVPGSDVAVTSGSTVNLTTAPLNGQVVDVFGYQGVGSLISGATYVRQTFTANSTVNTSFTITGGYTVNYIDVYKNGVKLINGTEVTATNGSTVVLAAAALSNDIVDVVGYNSVSLAAINTTAQYTWSNTLSFTANLSVSNASLLVGSNVVVNATSYFVGNSTVNTNITAAAIAMNGNSVYPSTSGFRRNRIINGAMQIDQRNSGSAQTFTAGAALAYSVDRWYGYCTGANVTGQRVAGSGTTQYRYQFTGAASVTAIGFAQRIETSNSYDLNNSTAVLSVDISNSLLTTVTWTAYYANTADTFGSLASPTRTQIATGTFTVTSTLTNYTTPISIPAAATTGIEIVFTVGAQTSGTWVIGNVQLEAGSSATPFERLSIGETLMLCQRYYEKTNDGLYRTNGDGGYYSYSVPFKVQKRAAPSSTWVAGIVNEATYNVSLLSIEVGGCSINFLRTSGVAGSAISGSIIASSEL